MLKNKKWLEETIRSMRYNPFDCVLKINPHQLTYDANELLFTHISYTGTLVLVKKVFENGTMFYYYEVPRNKKYV